MVEERSVGGLRCGEVLARLSDFIDDELPLRDREQVLNHLSGCDLCERFGGEFSAVLRQLREQLADDALPDEVTERLLSRLR